MKERLDKILYDLGYFETKSKAQAAIMAGNVKINGEKITKAGYQLEYNESLDIEVKSMPFVSRGGFKLEKAIKTFEIDLQDRICLDAGASTGGFTDCMLQHGAKKVYSVDVGYGQFAWKLRTNDKVKVVERMNIKNCTPQDIYDKDDKLPNFCATDLSFISIKKVLENILTLLSPQNIEIVTLIKPQFEAGKDEVGKNGVVRDKNIHIKVIKNVISFAEEIGLYTLNLTVSPIKGPAGNIEYLAFFSDKSDKKQIFDIESIVNTNFEQQE
jgi:23S rRNA (cytidine1920-2'-O)/16S rRNA (cytidine1409-2'-O)-methyltransferase